MRLAPVICILREEEEEGLLNDGRTVEWKWKQSIYSIDPVSLLCCYLSIHFFKSTNQKPQAAVSTFLIPLSLSCPSWVGWQSQLGKVDVDPCMVSVHGKSNELESLDGIVNLEFLYSFPLFHFPFFLFNTFFMLIMLTITFVFPAW